MLPGRKHGTQVACYHSDADSRPELLLIAEGISGTSTAALGPSLLQGQSFDAVLFRKPNRTADAAAAIVRPPRCRPFIAALASALVGTKAMPSPSPHDRRDFERSFDATPSRPGPPGHDELDVTIELGRTEMAMEDVLKLRAGAIVPLDNRAGDPVDVIINGRLVARGEVVVVEDTFCVRIVELFARSKAA
jgi:flagellar motor switch protein FliN/FliY